MNGPADRTIIVDLRIPFWRLVMFFIKASLAAIPAAIIVSLVIAVLMALVVGLLGGSWDIMMQRWRV